MAAVDALQRVCVKLYAPEPQGLSDHVFVPIFHEWIQKRVLADLVLVDVADYAHAPDSPGIMLISHETSFALDRADGRFGLLAQRRTSGAGKAADAIAETLKQALQVAARLERDSRTLGKLRFDPSTVRIEANDRLRAPNTEDAYLALEPHVRSAVQTVYRSPAVAVDRVPNDPRDRLTVDARVEAAPDVQAYAAA